MPTTSPPSPPPPAHKNNPWSGLGNCWIGLLLEIALRCCCVMVRKAACGRVPQARDDRMEKGSMCSGRFFLSVISQSFLQSSPGDLRPPSGRGYQGNRKNHRCSTMHYLYIFLLRNRGFPNLFTIENVRIFCLFSTYPYTLAASFSF